METHIALTKEQQVQYDRLLALDAAELVRRAAALMGSRGKLQKVAGCSRRTLARVENEGDDLPDFARECIARAIVLEGKVEPVAAPRPGRPPAALPVGGNMNFELAAGEKRSFEAAARGYPTGQKGLLSAYVRAYLRRHRHALPAVATIPTPSPHAKLIRARCRIEEDVLTQLDQRLGTARLVERNAYLRAAILEGLERGVDPSTDTDEDCTRAVA